MFSSGRKYSHKLTQLLDDLGSLDLSALSSPARKYLDRPTDEYEPEINAWLEYYSHGKGRYELLDSLASGSKTVPTWETWVQFCSRGSVSDEVRHYINLHRASGDALQEIVASHELESVASNLLKEFDAPISERSAGVGLAMYRRARWAASVLHALSYYTHPDLPILGEALVELRQSGANFFAFEIAGLSDPEVVEDELVEHRKSFVVPEDVHDELNDEDQFTTWSE